MNRKSNKKTPQIALIVILSVILAFLIGVAVFLNVTEGQQTPAETTAPSAPETTHGTTPTTEPTETTVDVEDLVITTDFCDLSFPGQWKEQLRTEFVESDDGGAVMFYGSVGGKEAALFTVLFSQSTSSVANPIGVIDVDGEPILVSVKMGESGETDAWSDEERDVIAAMREAINHLIGKLRAQPGFSGDIDAINPEPHEDIQVVTPYAVLRYPGQWQNQVWAEYAQTDDGGCATFYGAVGGEDVTLFEVRFGSAGEDSALVGYMKSNGDYVKVSLRLLEPENTDGWREKDWNLLAAMQEGVNDLLQDLTQNPAYTKEPGAVPPETTVPPATTTPPETTAPPSQGDGNVYPVFVDLPIPAQWQNQMRTKIEDRNGGYAVTFIGTVGNHEAVLFSVLFGAESEGSFPVGVMNVEGKDLAVRIELMDIETDDTWSDEEIDTISAMQESLNDVLGALSQNPNFTAE